MIAVVVVSLVWAIMLGLFGWDRSRAIDRCYRYAVEQAEKRDIMDPAGQAYSDMATVIVLDGKVQRP